MAEHVQRRYVPEVECLCTFFLASSPLMISSAVLLAPCSISTEFLGHYIGKHSLQGQITAVIELFELITAYPINQEAEHGEVFPRRNQPSKRISSTVFVGHAQYERDIDTDIAGNAGDFSEMIDFFRSRSDQYQLVDLAWSRWQHPFDIRIRLKLPNSLFDCMAQHRREVPLVYQNPSEKCFASFCQVNSRRPPSLQ